MSEPNGRGRSPNPPPELEKLLGGYATGSLSPAEKSALFNAALTDQSLFDALAEDESLRGLLSDDAAKSELLAAIRPPAPPPKQTWWALLWRPRTLAIAGSMATALLIAVALRPGPKPVPEVPQMPVAEVAADGIAAAPAAGAPIATAPAEPAQPVARAKRAYAIPGSAVPGSPPPAAVELSAPDVQRDSRDLVAMAPPAVRPASPAPAPPAGPAKKLEEAKEAEKARADRQALSQAVTVEAVPEASRLADARAEARGRAPAESDRDQKARSEPSASNVASQSLGASQMAHGQGFRYQPSAAVTNVSGNVVTINAGRDQSFASGDMVEIRRGNQLLGVVQLTEIEGSSAKGTFTGSTRPRPGDVVRPRPKADQKE